MFTFHGKILSAVIFLTSNFHKFQWHSKSGFGKAIALFVFEPITGGFFLWWKRLGPFLISSAVTQTRFLSWNAILCLSHTDVNLLIKDCKPGFPHMLKFCRTFLARILNLGNRVVIVDVSALTATAARVIWAWVSGSQRLLLLGWICQGRLCWTKLLEICPPWWWWCAIKWFIPLQLVFFF